MIQTNLLGRLVRLKGETGKGPNSHYTYEIVGAYLDEGVPCVLLLGRDGGLHSQLTAHVQVKVD